MPVVGFGVIVVNAKYILSGDDLGFTAAKTENTKEGNGELLVVGLQDEGSKRGLVIRV